MGMERGTPFALAHTFRQTGPFRPRNVDKRVPGLVFVGLVDRAGRRRADGPRLRQARRGARTRDGAAMTTLEASYAECRRLNKRHGTTYYWSTMVLPSVKRHHVHALYGFCRYADDIVDDPLSSRVPIGGRTGRRPEGLRRALLHRPRRRALRRPRAQSGRAHGAGLRHRPRGVPAVPPLDGHGPGGRPLRDLRRPARVHGRLGRGDR